MDTHQAIRTRRTAHVWEPTKVPEDVIQRALEAAHLAPCHRLTWPWRFTLPGPGARAALFEVGLKLNAAKTGREPDEALRHKLTSKLKNPELIVVSQTLCDDPHQLQEDYAACACAIHNLSLSLHADGFHSKWSTGGLTTHPDTYEIMEIGQDAERIIGFVWLGIPAKQPALPNRPDLHEYIRRLN